MSSVVFKQISSAEEIHWITIQYVSCSPVFYQIQSTDKAGKTIKRVSHSPVFNQIQLTMLAEHPSRRWVALVIGQIQLTNKVGWTPIQRVSGSPVSDQILSTDKVGWTLIHPASELLSIVWPNHINWQGWLKTCPGGESLHFLTKSYLLTRLAEHPSSKWVALQCLTWCDQLTKFLIQAVSSSII